MVWNLNTSLRFHFYKNHAMYTTMKYNFLIPLILGGARGVMVIVLGYGHDDTSSNPVRDWLHFT